MTLPAGPAALPFLGAGLGYQHALHAEILAHRDGIDFLEVPTDVFLPRLPGWTDRLLELKRSFPTVAHGIHLSLGEATGLSAAYLDRLAPYLDTLQPVWFSDHLDLGNVPDLETGMAAHGIPVPFTREQAAVFRQNIRHASARIGRPLLVENLFYEFVIPVRPALPEPAFIRAALEGTEAGLLLDLTNLYLNAANFGFDPYDWLEQAPVERTVEIHVAGGEKRARLDGRERWVDTHSQAVPDAVWRLVEYVVARAPVKAIVLERDQNYPSLPEITRELAIARAILQAGAAPRPTGSVPRAGRSRAER